jgi:hypothetical protein
VNFGTSSTVIWLKVHHLGKLPGSAIAQAVGFLSQRPGFEAGVIHVGFVLGKVALGEGSSLGSLHSNQCIEVSFSTFSDLNETLCIRNEYMQNGRYLGSY